MKHNGTWDRNGCDAYLKPGRFFKEEGVARLANMLPKAKCAKVRGIRLALLLLRWGGDRH